MVTMVQCFSSLQAVAIVALGWITLASAGTSTGGSPQSLDWSLHAPKDAYYPGEPVLLTMALKNNSPQQEEVHFADDLEVSSIEIRNPSGEVVAKGSTINRPEGGLRPTSLRVPPGQASGRSVVLNRWCSTLLLPAGTYEVLCRIKYRLGSEFSPPSGSMIRQAGPIHTIEAKLNVSITQMDLAKFKDMLEELRRQAFPTMFMKKIPTVQEEYAAKEMLASTESTLAVPYQLEILAGGGLSTQVRRDAVNSLARSKALEAAVGLMKLVENRGFEDVRWDLVQAVYRIRETGQPEIITATDEFIQKHKRSTLRWRQVERDASN